MKISNHKKKYIDFFLMINLDDWIILDNHLTYFSIFLNLNKNVFFEKSLEKISIVIA